MSSSRLDSFRAMVAKNPANALARFGLANEAVKQGLLEEAREHYREYLGAYDDEGNGWQRYAEVLVALGETDAAREAFQKGMAAAHRFGHPGMVAEMEDRLAELNQDP